MALPILPQALPAGASPDNEYVRQASGRVLRIDRAKCFFPSACPGCANCDTLCEVEEVVEKARGFVEASQSAATRRAYSADWRDFAGYCDERCLDALPATMLAAISHLLCSDRFLF
jgi:hypothetical protein